LAIEFCQKQIASHTAHVIVGVTNNLILLVQSQVSVFVSSRHQAHTGLGGQTNGVALVIAANIGNHSVTFCQSHTGYQSTTGSPHGARGAQFTGELIHDHPQNQLHIPSATSSTHLLTSSTPSFIESKKLVDS
jgi:hypothetical protein